MKTVRINQGKSLHVGLRILVTLASIILMVLSFKVISEPWSILVAILLSLISPAAWFATKIFEIDPTKKKLFKGSWFMGFRLGDWFEFKDLDIMTKKTRIKKTEFSLPDGKKLFTNQEYQVFLLADSEEHYLFGHPLKERIDEKIQTLNKKLELNTK